MKKTIKFKFSDLPPPVKEDFLLEIENGKIKRKELSPALKEKFVDSEKSSFAFFIKDIYEIF